MRAMFRITVIYYSIQGQTMKKLFTLILLSAMTLASQAVPMQWTESIEFDDIYFSGWKKGGVQSYTYTHDLKTDGFTPGQDLVWDYDLSINLFDDQRDRKKEFAFIDQPGHFGDKNVEISFKDVDLGISFWGLYSINTSGLLELTINRNRGDFILGGSTIAATGYTANVPEPAPFILFAVAIVGFFIVQRKRKLGK